MEKFTPYDKIIENKLAHFPEEDTDLLWQDMKTLLDKKMPQRKEDPKLWGWSCWEFGALALGSIFMIVIGASSLFTINGGPVASRPLVQAGGKPDATAIVMALPQDVNAGVKTGLHKSSLVFTARTRVSHKETVAYTPVNRRNDAGRQSVTGEPPATTPAGTKQQQDQATAVTSIFHNSYTGAIAVSHSLMNHQAPVQGLTSFDSVVAVDRSKLRGTVIDSKTFDSLLAIQKKMHARYGQRGFYAAFMAGIDLSSVQFRSMRSGANKGIVVGYALNRHWSIESGLFWEKKNFRGHGDDMHPDGYTLPAGVTLLSVQGRNQLYEWPLTMRYSILPYGHKLFVTAGLSSYFMKKESFDYKYEYNGQYGVSYSGFENETKNWFSVASVGIGYSHRLGAVGSVRIEPYLKLPLNNIGVNKMPVLSTGLNVGFTRGIFK